MNRLPARREESLPARRLYRDPAAGMIGGVCEGLGRRFGIDPVWLRVAYVVAFLSFGIGIVPYLVAWLVLPKRLPEPPPESEMPPELVEAWKEVNDLTEN